MKEKKVFWRSIALYSYQNGNPIENCNYGQITYRKDDFCQHIERALNAKLTYFHRTANLNKPEEEKSNGSCWFALAFEIIGLFIVLKLDTAHLKTWMRVEVPWWWFSPAMREELAAHLRVLRVTYCWVILRFTKTTSCYVSTATGKREWCWHVIISWSYTVIGDISPLFKESSCECVSFTTDTKHCYQYFTNCFCEILSQ